MARILIVEARFYDHLNDMLLAGARAAIEEAGHHHETVTVPGALEVPGAIALAAETGRYDSYVAIGVVNLDSIPSDEALDAVRKHPHILSLSMIKLPPRGVLPSWLAL